ncbi:type II toxin-antitoxin system VapB family antitoxin [Phycicoccus sonneratiae]|uniref:Type II toxin-antitoxin system VapB family antitoxin n=1 Tax=Phycicoccus sonneratiae TaxID=2807628 RepID=A0ABS2CK84_9MICO|nr:type II toxin-antitoxin system VapB family antitoxin [Phycicoccus sonneraticus]MBM6400274.1 type II toxin-antitoxin system VapB family antitoxin [Phycicoccus sonneraticus]
MSLNIKKPRVHELAREAASRTGLSQTSVIEAALEHYLEMLTSPDDDAARRGRIDAILADIDRSLTDEDREAIRNLDLYDERGLPA